MVSIMGRSWSSEQGPKGKSFINWREEVAARSDSRQRKAAAQELSSRYNLPTSRLYNFSRPSRKITHSPIGRPSLVALLAEAEELSEMRISKMNLRRGGFERKTPSEDTRD